jgi:hypothetical protein
MSQWKVNHSLINFAVQNKNKLLVMKIYVPILNRMKIHVPILNRMKIHVPILNRMKIHVPILNRMNISSLEVYNWYQL